MNNIVNAGAIIPTITRADCGNACNCGLYETRSNDRAMHLLSHPYTVQQVNNINSPIFKRTLTIDENISPYILRNSHSIAVDILNLLSNCIALGLEPRVNPITKSVVFTRNTHSSLVCKQMRSKMENIFTESWKKGLLQFQNTENIISDE